MHPDEDKCTLSVWDMMNGVSDDVAKKAERQSVQFYIDVGKVLKVDLHYTGETVEYVDIDAPARALGRDLTTTYDMQVHGYHDINIDLIANKDVLPDTCIRNASMWCVKDDFLYAVYSMINISTGHRHPRLYLIGRLYYESTYQPVPDLRYIQELD